MTAFDFTSSDTQMFSLFSSAATIGGEAIENGIIFDSPHQIVTTSGELVDSRQYQATAITADLDALATTIANMTTQIVIASTTYLIKDARPDGLGFTLLDLLEV